jgi:hypothetical protein
VLKQPQMTVPVSIPVWLSETEVSFFVCLFLSFAKKKLEFLDTLHK